MAENALVAVEAYVILLIIARRWRIRSSGSVKFGGKGERWKIDLTHDRRLCTEKKGK
jgi:hypothetical protein